MDKRKPAAVLIAAILAAGMFLSGCSREPQSVSYPVIGTWTEGMKATDEQAQLARDMSCSEKEIKRMQEEGKLNGLKSSRAIFDEEHRVVDIICGPFFICDCSGENFGSLNAEQLDKYVHQFECPEHYYRINDNIVALPYVPSSEMSRMR